MYFSIRVSPFFSTSQTASRSHQKETSPQLWVFAGPIPRHHFGERGPDATASGWPLREAFLPALQPRSAPRRPAAPGLPSGACAHLAGDPAPGAQDTTPSPRPPTRPTAAGGAEPEVAVSGSPSSESRVSSLGAWRYPHLYDLAPGGGTAGRKRGRGARGVEHPSVSLAHPTALFYVCIWQH